MPLTNNQKLHALGLATYKPSTVTYTVSPAEFSALFVKYCNDYMKFKAEPQVELKFTRNEGKIETFTGYLHILNIDDLPNGDYQRLMGMGIDEDRDHKKNFETAMRILFFTPDYYEISGEIDEFSNCIFVTCPYKDFVKYGLPSDLIDSET